MRFSSRTSSFCDGFANPRDHASSLLVGCLLWAALLIGAMSAPVSAQTASTASPQPASDTGVVRQIGAPAGPPRVGEELEVVTEDVSAKLRCPVCQGMSVSDSPSASARAMKDEIQELLAQGYSPLQVNEYFENTYGEFVLLDPKREGLNWLLLLAPGALFLGGLVAIGFQLRRRAKSAENAPVDTSLDPYLARVRNQLNAEQTTSHASPTDAS